MKITIRNKNLDLEGLSKISIKNKFFEKLINNNTNLCFVYERSSVLLNDLGVKNGN